MTLSCDCGAGDYDWFYEVEDEERVAATSFVCYGCCKPFPVATEVRRINELEFDLEGDGDADYMPVRILGRLCMECAGLYDSLTELGFCIDANRGFIKVAMDQYRKEYAPYYGG
jgi:hypothetical protein